MHTYPKTAKIGPGRFQWSGGGWFGSQVGGTMWMLIAGAVLLTVDVRPAGLVILCFVLANLLGAFLWTRRHLLAPYPAIQLLLVTIGLFALLAAITIDGFGRLGALDARLNGRPFLLYLSLLIFPAMMVLFHRLERKAVRGA